MNCAAGCEAVAEKYGLCNRCDQLLAGMCLGKKRHWRLLDAKLAAASGSAEAAYRCLVCGLYHVGTASGHSRQLQAARESVVRRLRRNGKGALLTRLAEQWRTASRTRWKASGRRGA